MRLACAGCNWKTPVDLRERLTIDAARLPQALGLLRSRSPHCEFAILSTCNRTEVYVGWTDNDCPPFHVESLAGFLAEFQSLPPEVLRDQLNFREGVEAARHLFNVAAGLDSLVLGEVQILGQTRDAYRMATEAGAVGPALHPLFQRALGVAKRIQTETTLSKGKLSIASAAVDFIQGVFEDLRDKSVLVIGAGKMAELTLTHLKELRPRKTLLANRSIERAETLAAKFGGEVRPFDQLMQALVDADVVVSSTGAEQCIVKAGDFEKVAAARRGRHMAIVDIAVPRDFDHLIGGFENVFLWNIDHLERVRHQTLRARESALDHAYRIVDQELASFRTASAAQQTGPLLSKLEAEWQRITEQELSWLLPQLNGMPEGERDKIRQFAHRLRNKFLHSPRTALRREAKDGSHVGLLEALRKLFGL